LAAPRRLVWLVPVFGGGALFFNENFFFRAGNLGKLTA
jgi:hypothetical protein